MAREYVKLELKDMYAIKHALQNVVRQKNNRLQDICTQELPQNYDHELEMELNRLNKDIARENALIIRFEQEITDFKDKYKLGS